MNNFRKTLLIASVVCPSITYASPSGYYVSGNLGIFQADFNNRYLDQTDVISLNIAQLTSQRGYTVGFAVGYRQECAGQYLLGAELSANADGQKALFQSGASSAAFSDGLQINYHTDLLFVPGLKLSECVFAYLKLGISLAFIEDNLTSPVGFNPIYTNYHSNKERLGFAAGLGVAKSLTPQISIFTEANYHDYGTVDFPNFQNFSATYGHQTHIYSYDIVVGASYQFA